MHNGDKALSRVSAQPCRATRRTRNHISGKTQLIPNCGNYHNDTQPDCHAPLPYLEELTSWIASSRVSTCIQHRTGPNTSSSYAGMPGPISPDKTVGPMKFPSPYPGTDTPLIFRIRQEAGGKEVGVLGDGGVEGQCRRALDTQRPDCTCPDASYCLLSSVVHLATLTPCVVAVCRGSGLTSTGWLGTQNVHHRQHSRGQ